MAGASIVMEDGNEGGASAPTHPLRNPRPYIQETLTRECRGACAALVSPNCYGGPPSIRAT